VDYRAWVWVNGVWVAYHEGGHTPFQADITPALRRENRLVVRVEFTPDIDRGEAMVEFYAHHSAPDQQLEVEVTFAGEIVAAAAAPLSQARIAQTLSLKDPQLWSPERPNLYKAVLRIKAGDEVVDEVHSDFGMRKIAVENGAIMLNNRPLTMNLVLDQGYHPKGLLTPPTDDDIRRDVELVKAMGFNGVRKHQKDRRPALSVLG